MSEVTAAPEPPAPLTCVVCGEVGAAPILWVQRKCYPVHRDCVKVQVEKLHTDVNGR